MGVMCDQDKSMKERDAQFDRNLPRRSPSSEPRSRRSSRGATAGMGAWEATGRGRGPDMLGARDVAALPLLLGALLRKLLLLLLVLGDSESSSTVLPFLAAMAGEGSGEVEGEREGDFSEGSCLGDVDGASWSQVPETRLVLRRWMGDC